MEDGGLEISDSLSLYGLTLSDVVPLQKLTPQTSWRAARKERITMLAETASSLVRPPDRAAESGD